MNKLGISAVVVLLAGCATSTPIADALIVGMIGAQAVDYSRNPNPPPFPSFSDLYDWRGTSAAPPPLAPGRVINEQDCSQPIDLFKGNIRCK